MRTCYLVYRLMVLVFLNIPDLLFIDCAGWFQLDFSHGVAFFSIAVIWSWEYYLIYFCPHCVITLQ